MLNQGLEPRRIFTQESTSDPASACMHCIGIDGSLTPMADAKHQPQLRTPTIAAYTARTPVITQQLNKMYVLLQLILSQRMLVHESVNACVHRSHETSPRTRVLADCGHAKCMALSIQRATAARQPARGGTSIRKYCSQTECRGLAALINCPQRLSRIRFIASLFTQ